MSFYAIGCLPKIAIMKHFKTNPLQLKIRTLLTFENKTVKKGNSIIDTDPTTTTLPTTHFPVDLFVQLPKKD
jgi:hypothetical protein